MHDHTSMLTFLQTPWGYLTNDGFTKDVNDKNIVVLPSNTYGKWSDMDLRIKRFAEETDFDDYVVHEILEKSEHCKTISYRCPKDACCENLCKLSCQFWNGNRYKCNLEELLSL